MVLSEGSKALGDVLPLHELVAGSVAMQACVRLARAAAIEERVVIFDGESGVGKRTIACALHLARKSAIGPLVVFCSGTVPTTMQEEAFFGAEGAFCAARGGTLLLLYAEDIVPSIWTELVRRMKTQSTHRSERVQLLVTCIATKCLPSLEGLAPLLCTVPPLRKRGEDVGVLVRRFFASAKRSLSAMELRIDPAVYSLFEKYSWPGNVREMHLHAEKAVFFAVSDKKKVLTPEDCFDSDD